MRPGWRGLIAILILTGIYFCAGKLGLSWAYLHASASPVWPPTGIALAALLCWGYNLWPGIFFGAFLVNITTQGTVLTTLGIAAGNTLEALAAAWAINRFANGARAFERARNTFKFVLIAALLSPVVSATFGVTSLTLAGFADWNQYPAIWLTWWLGDAVADLIVAPFLLILMTEPYPELKPKRVVEAAALLLSMILPGYLIFLRGAAFSAEYIMVLPLLWAAFRFGQRGAVTSALIVAVIAVIGTLHGVGPFVHADPNESLLHLQAFMGTIAIAALVLASVVSEGKRAEQRLQVQDAISRILAESPALKDAAPRILQILCERAGWNFGAVWSIHRVTNELRCVEAWHVPSTPAPHLEADTKERRFIAGVGLPGRVWSTRKPTWIPDLTADSNFPRAPIAAKDKLHGAFGFPIKLGDEILGVIECFSREIREPDDHFLQMVGDIGGQVGQFMERKRAEDDLSAQRSQLRAVTEITPVILTQCSRDLRFTFVNRAHAEMFGVSPEQIIGRTVPEVIGTEAFETIRPHVETVLKGRPVEFEAEVPHERTGSRFVRVFYMPDKDEHGQIRGWIASISDITERKRAEELLRQAKDELVKANEALEKRVHERTADLEQANAALVKTIEEQKSLEEQLRQAQKMEIIGTLAGGIAHDFNNILNIIWGYANLIGQQSAADQQINENLRVIDEQIKRGATVVRQLLTVARKTDTHLAPTDANELILTFSELIKQAFPKTINVALNLDPDLPRVLADPNQMSQALLNICLNARDAMQRGGNLTIKTELIDEKDMRERFKADAGACICIVVSDTGTGMREEVRNRIFEPFFTTKGIGEGTGLGLAIVYGIVKQHNGFIDVDSAPGQGATFRLCLPIFQAKEKLPVDQMTTRETSSRQHASHRGTILVVEDDEAMIYLLKKLLPESGYQILAATDGAEAIDLYLDHQQEIDIVLLDLGLPKVAGLDVIHKMKEHNPAVKIVVATGYLEPELKSEIFRAGVSDCINKPYRVHDVLVKLGALIETS